MQASDMQRIFRCRPISSGVIRLHPLAGKAFGYHLAKRTSLQKRFGVLVYVAGCGADASRHTTPQCNAAAATARHRAARPASE
jgi:hypothetical protein